MSRQESADLLDQLRKDFADAFKIFDAMPKDGKGMARFDEQGREWYINHGEGLVQFIIQDLTHHLYRNVVVKRVISSAKTNSSTRSRTYAGGILPCGHPVLFYR